MSREEVIIDVGALSNVSDSATRYLQNAVEAFDRAIKSMEYTSESWNDEDFNRLLSAMRHFSQLLDSLGEDTQALLGAIREKIDAIHRLHNIKI